tara:strand:+ start:328 stop:486 length:159 start_codon:yes stop_codon:yes gene_type:complete
MNQIKKISMIIDWCDAIKEKAFLYEKDLSIEDISQIEEFLQNAYITIKQSNQ